MSRIKTALTLTAAFISILMGVFVIASQTAYATTTTTSAYDACANLKDWGPNEDEEARRPLVTTGGLEFTTNQLVHHKTDLALADLKPGSFVATHAPDQPSFFSVEITDSTTGAYGTLRWNPGEGEHGEWDLTTTGPAAAQYHKADPVDYIGVVTKFGTITAHARVFTFGVGYTLNPPGTVDTVVSSVTFGGKTYPMTCPAPHGSASATPHKTTLAPKPHGSSATHVAGAAATGKGDGGALAVTGPSLPKLLIVVAVLLVLGAFIVGVTRRRRTRFQA